MVCGALRPGRQKGNARPGLGSHARAQRLQLVSWDERTAHTVFFLDEVPGGHDGRGFSLLVATGLGIGPSNASVWLVLTCALSRATNLRSHVTNSSAAIFLSVMSASIG